METCRACIAFSVKNGQWTLYDPEFVCSSMSRDQCGGEIAKQDPYLPDKLEATGLTLDDVEPILGTGVRCQKHPHLRFGDPFP